MNLRELARLANVSTATASNALSGNRPVAKATKRRVLDLANRYEYQPRAAARALVTGRCRTIGLVCECGYLAGRDWLLDIQGGLVDAMEAHGYHVLLFRAEPTPENLPPAVLERSVDGLVVVLSWTPDFLATIQARSVPAVVANPARDVACDQVGVDEAEAACKAVRHLLCLQHRRVAYIGTVNERMTHVNAQRWQGYAEAISEAALPLLTGTPLAATETALLDGCLVSGSPPTGLVCFSDLLALKVIRQLRERGISVPRDMSVVSIDDASFAREFIPALTTIRIPFQRIGAEAGRLLLDRIREPDRPARRIVLPTELIVRDSTAAPAETAPAARNHHIRKKTPCMHTGTALPPPV